MKRVLLMFGATAMVSVSFAQALKTYPEKTANQKLSASTVADFEETNIHLNEDGQRAVIWSNDFSVPADWTFGSAGAQGNWQVGTNANIGQLSQYMGQMQSTTAANGFGFFNGVQYLIQGSVLAQDCWVVTANNIDMTGAGLIRVEFQQRYRAFNSDRTFVEISTDGGATWTSKEVNDAVPTNTSTIANRIITFDSQGSATVKLRFRWTGEADNQFGSGYGWMVDDIIISNSPNHELILTEIGSGIYTKFPIGQEDRDLVLWGKVLNDGALAQTNVKLGVTADGTSVGSSAPLASLAPLASDSLNATLTYRPSGSVGVKALVYTLTQDSTDAIPANNTMNKNIEVTASTFSRDRGIYTGNGFATMTLGNNPITELAVAYELTANANATSISFVLDRETNAGAVYKATLYQDDLETIIAESDLLTVTAANINTAATNTPVTVRADFFNQAYPLTPGTYWAVVSQESDTVSLAYDPLILDHDQMALAKAGGNWGSAIGGLRMPMIRLNLNEAGVGIKESNLNGSVSVFPNPTSDLLNISLKDFSGMTQVKVFNMNGQEVFSERVNVASSSFVKTIDVSGFAAGIYTVNLTSASGVASMKVSVQ